MGNVGEPAGLIAKARFRPLFEILNEKAAICSNHDRFVTGLSHRLADPSNDELAAVTGDQEKTVAEQDRDIVRPNLRHYLSKNMIAVVIPCYKVRQQILDVLQGIGPECEWIYVVDDCCPEGSGTLVQDQCTDPRVKVIFHKNNRGVGGATISGLRAAVDDGAEIIVKLDGDGQMDPGFIPKLISPVQAGEADYAKGNRFYDLDGLKPMPPIRLVGNAALSFASKLSSGYWNIFDPTNGYTAIHAKIAKTLPLHKISERWFFESDLLFRLGIQRAVVCDVPMPATYRDETSSLRISQVLFVFSWKHLRNTLKRIFYSYYLRDFNVASIELFLGLVFLGFGTWTGVKYWGQSAATGEVATSGTVMLAALPIILGMQFLLAFLGFDLRNMPTNALHRRL